MDKHFDFSIDWLEFTYKVPLEFTPKEESKGVETLNGLDLFENFRKDFPEIMRDWEINADQVTLLDKCRNFYNVVFSFSDDYTVCYHSEKKSMGVHVTFPGHGIYKIAEIFGLKDLNEHEAARRFFRILDERNCEITRLDIAYDDYTKTFTPRDFNLWQAQERINTASTVMGYIKSGQASGDTFYIGRRGKERMIRIYDKNYESNGKINAIRYEFELKKDWARVVQNHVMNDKRFCFADLLDSMFTIKEDWGFDDYHDSYINKRGIETPTLSNTQSQRKYRADIDEKWQLFLETIRKIYDDGIVDVSLNSKKEQCNFKRTYNWLRDYCVPSLFICREVMGTEKFEEFMAYDLDKLNPKKRSLLASFKKEWERGIFYESE